MRPFPLICITGCLLSGKGISATYYVSSSSGNDSYTAVQAGNTATPWKTVARVSAYKFSPGDKILFKRGDIWREQLVIASSGAEGNTILYGSYGTGNLPEFRGSDTVSGWKLYSGNIYVADVRGTVKQLFIDGVRQTYARWPNTGWATISTDAATSISLRSKSLNNSAGYWTGATAVIRSAPWAIETRTVTGSSADSIQWAAATTNPVKKDFGFYIEGKLAEVDRPGEWYYASSGKLYLYVSPGDLPSKHVIEASVRDHGVEVSSGKQQLVIQELAVKHTTVNGIYVNNASYVWVKNNNISYTGGRGIIATTATSYSHHHIYITGNTVFFTGGEGIRVATLLDCEIKDNVVSYVAMDTISPKKSYGITIYGTRILVSGNYVHHTSFDGIYLGPTDTVTVSGNTITDCMQLLNDGGGFYTEGKHTAVLIEKNVIRDIPGNTAGTPETLSSAAGIYLDESCNGVRVQENLVLRVGAFGIKLHKAYNNLVVNNVAHDNRIAALRLEENAQNQMHNNDFYNNIFSAASASQVCLSVKGSAASTVATGNFDNNIYYLPTGTKISRYQRGIIPNTLYVLTELQTALLQDRSSLTVDPQFKNPLGSVAADYMLLCSSPAINAGKVVNVTTDFFNNSIINAPDIGIHEFQGSPCATK